MLESCLIVSERISICASFLDASTVRLLESKSPACRQDRQQLEEHMQSRMLFPQVKDPKLREEVWKRVCTIRWLFPTFRTLFSDLEYLTRCHKIILTGLTIRPCPTITGSLFHMFAENVSCIEACSQLRRDYSHCGSRTCHHFKKAYLKLMLFVMRHRLELEWFAQRADLRCCLWPKGNAIPPQQSGRVCLAQYAQTLGFENAFVHETNIDHARWQEHDDVCHKIESDDEQECGPLKRSGVPHIDEESLVRRYLFIETMRLPWGEEEHVTSVFARRCFVDRFFDLVANDARGSLQDS